MVNNYFTICSLFYSIMLSIIYFKRKKIKFIETEIYSRMVITNLFNVVLAIICAYTIINKDSMPLINNLVGKTLILLFLTWELFFTIYIVAITINKKINVENLMKKYKNYFFIGFVFLTCFIYLLPLYYHNENNVVYSYGPSANLVYGLTALLIFFWVILILMNREILKNKKLIPVIVFIFLTIVAVIIQKINPGLLLITATETFITVLMYFTIENPDVNMLNEVYKNKELMEQTYEDKYNFLFEMTQEARNPLININRVYNEIKDENDPKIIKDGLSAINNLTRQLDFSINNILNISSFDIQKIKIIENKYDLEKFCNNLSTIIKSEIKSGVIYTDEIPKQLPILYGDSLKLRQILYSLLNNSCKYTDEGTIIFKVNVIEKYDICRVVFNIIDTGRGIPIEEINDILSSTGELSQSEVESLDKKEFNIKLCQKVIKIMGGNLMIKSNENSGTEMILTIDQRVYHEKEDSIINKYANQIANYHKVLIIAQTKEYINLIKKKLKDNNIMYSHFLNGYDAIDKIKSGSNYDLIIIEDEMQKINGFVTMQELKKIKKFNTPCIVLLRREKENIKEHYVEDGFKGAIITNKLNSELDKIIEDSL